MAGLLEFIPVAGDNRYGKINTHDSPDSASKIHYATSGSENSVARTVQTGPPAPPMQPCPTEFQVPEAMSLSLPFPL